jgi:4-amino-4-deoxy-L-arabinose transferase-like glycosyltransferase
MILGAQRLRVDAVVSLIEHRRSWFITGLCFLWMLPGLVGRDPWKPEEASIFGVVLEALAGGHWLVPQLAGEVFLRHPPLYYWIAAGSGELFSAWLPLHDAVRLVNLACVGATFWLVARAAGHLNGRGLAWLAPLVLIGCIGLAQPAHQLVPENALLLSHGLAAYGLASAGAAVAPASLALGLGVGVAFLSRGMSSALPLLLAAAWLPLLCAHLRHTAYRRFLLLSAVVALPWIVLWPLHLFLEEPALFQIWWGSQTGYFASIGSGALGTSVSSLQVLAWFSWPAWPFALLSLWQGRRQLAHNAALAVPLVLLVSTLLVLAMGQDRRAVLVLPTLIPLALLAHTAVPDLRRGAVNAFFWFGIAFFLFLFAAAWFYFSAVDFGLPERAARHMARMEPGYVPVVSLPAMATAGVLTLAWLLALFNIRRSPARPFVTWAVGMVAFWAVLMLLMVGWADHAKSYRGMIASLSQALPRTGQCMVGSGLGDSQRALLHYFAGIRPQQVDSGGAAGDCDLLLVENRRSEPPLGHPWELVWEGHRPGDTQERYRLYRRNPRADAQPR